MPSLAQPSFWVIQCDTYFVLRTLCYSRKLKVDQLARRGALLRKSFPITLLKWHHSNWLSRGNFPKIPIYPESMRIPAPLLGPFSLQWTEGAPTSDLDLVVSSSRSQCIYLQVTVLWVDKRKECDSPLAISAMDADPLSKRKLLYNFSVNSSLLHTYIIGHYNPSVRSTA